jgi:ankyrin repeat protein
MFLAQRRRDVTRLLRRLRAVLAPALLAAPLFGAAADVEYATLADAAMNRDTAAVRALLERDADVNALGTYDTPALHWVVRVQDRATAGLLLDAGADPNLPDRHGIVPLHLAIENGDRATVDLLLAAGADLGMRDSAGDAPLSLAARVGSAAIAERLLARGAQVDERDLEYGQTALMVAVREGHLEVARLLLANGADVNAQTQAGAVPAFRLPSENAGSKGVGIVRGGWPEHGMRPPTPGAKTPLLYATRRGELAATRLLVEAGAALEQADADGVTPLTNAILNASIAAARDAPSGKEHLAVAQYLLERGANVNSADWYGQTPLWAAVDVRNLDVNGPMRDNRMDRAAALELIIELLARGADPNARIREHPSERRFITGLGSLAWVDFTGQTPFLRAALAGDVTVMRLLLEHGADPAVGTFGGTTPLMAAAGVNWVVNQTFDEGPAGLLAAVELCYELGNDVNAVNSMGIGAIHGAANRGSNDIIEFLAAHGARLDAPDAQGRTPLAWAEGVFLATHPPQRKPATIALLERLLSDRRDGR